MFNIKKTVMMSSVAAFIGLTCSAVSVSAQQLSDHSNNTVVNTNRRGVNMQNPTNETMWDKTKDGTTKAWDKTKEVSSDAWEATKDAVTPDKN